MRLSPVLAEQTTYPFVRLEQAKRRLAAAGTRVIDLGTGDPREPTDPLIERALVEALPQTAGYPLSEGLPELRRAIARWLSARFAVELDADREIIPTLGSKEAIFSFAQVVIDRDAEKRAVAIPDPAYPVYERGAQFAHAEVIKVPLVAANDFLPDLDAIPADVWERIALFWINYPNNPTGATAPLALYDRLAELAATHGFLLASDEAYSELWFDEPPASALQVADRARVVVFNTLSKRSSMTGYRSGFVAAAEPIIEALRKYRPTAGTAPQEFVQRASVVAWGDEQHVERARERYRRKRAAFLDVFARKGLAVAASRAGMYLWVEVPPAETSESFAERLLEHGVVVAPGSYLGEAGEGYLRLALVPTEEECAEAAKILDRIV